LGQDDAKLLTSTYQEYICIDCNEIPGMRRYGRQQTWVIYKYQINIIIFSRNTTKSFIISL